VRKIFRSVAGDGIRGLRSTRDVPEDAVEEEEAAMAVEQNLTAKQKEDEPGQYGRLLRLYAGTFRGFNVIEEPSRGDGIDVKKDGAGKENATAPDWLEAISGWAPIAARKTQGPKPPKGVNTKRGFHVYIQPQSPSL